MTKIDIISGFLGAGKTTLIKKLVAENKSGEKIVLIENEFGDVNIDSKFLQNTNLKISALTSGCICCTLIGDFGKALKKIMAEIKPDRILIEPSGVAKAGDIIKAVKIAAVPNVEINSISNVVDVSVCEEYIDNFGEFYKDQISHAGCVIMSRTDECDDEKLKSAAAAVKTLNKKSIIVTTPWNDLSGEQLYDAMCSGGKVIEKLIENTEDICDCPDHHHADDVFSTVSYETVRCYNKEELELKLGKLTECRGIVLRAKGIVKSADGGWFHFDFVPNKVDIRTGTPSVTGMICVIGKDIIKEEIFRTLVN